jgi:hypothetical protein
MHANRDTDPREIPEISDSITFLLGQDPTCADGPCLPSAAGVKMRSCTRRTDEKSPHAPTAAMPSKSRICICTIGQAASHFFEQAASLGGGSRWLEAEQQLPRFHRKALIFDVSSQVASEIPSTGWLPVQCYLYPTKTTLWHPGLSQLASKNAKKIENVFDKFKNLYWLAQQAKHAGAFSGKTGDGLAELYTAVQRPKTQAIMRTVVPVYRNIVSACPGPS